MWGLTVDMHLSILDTIILLDLWVLFLHSSTNRAHSPKTIMQTRVRKSGDILVLPDEIIKALEDTKQQQLIKDITLNRRAH